MNKELLPFSEKPSDEEPLPLSQQIFADYYASLADRTRKRQRKELEGLRTFLQRSDHVVSNLAFDATSWTDVKSEEIAKYLNWLKEQRYTASSLSNLLYTIRTYARIAAEHGFFSQTEYQHLETIKITPDQAGQPRIGKQKSMPLTISDTQAQYLLDQPPTRRGQTDALIMALFLRCGLWPREVAALNCHSLNIEKGTLTFYDHNAEEEHTLTLDTQTLAIAKAYLREHSPYEALFVGNRKEGEKQQRLTDRALNARVRTLGERIGLSTLSPHDCHVYWEHQRDHVQPEQQAIQNIAEMNKDTATIHTHHETATSLYQPTLPQQEVPVTERPSRRKTRPDIWNRRSFEKSMHEHGVADSMIATYISEYRLLLPLMVKHLDKEAFLQQLQQERQDLKLSSVTDEFWKGTLQQIEYWMQEQLEQYQATRSENTDG